MSTQHTCSLRKETCYPSTVLIGILCEEQEVRQFDVFDTAQ